MHENGDGIYYLASGQCDLLISHLPSALKASSQGAQIKIAGMLIKEPLNALIYRKDKDILTPSDLSGHVLGYCLGGPDSSFLDYLLQEGPIYPREKHNVSADLISAIGTASVDVIYGGFWNIEPAQLRSLGVETDFFTMQSFHVPLYYEMLVLSSLGTQYSKITFIEPFQRALQKSIDFCKAHPDQAFAAYLRQNPDKRKKNLSWEEEAWKTTYPLLTKDQLIDPECIENCYSWFLERKIINHPFDFHRLY